jgi:hypothetical protein
MQELTYCTGRCHTQVSIDVDFANTVLDTFLDLFNRYAVGLTHVTTVVVDDFQPFLWNRRRTMHNQVSVRDARVDFLDTVDTQDVTGRLFGELVSTVRSTDSDCQGIYTSCLNEIGRFVSIEVSS